MERQKLFDFDWLLFLNTYMGACSFNRSDIIILITDYDDFCFLSPVKKVLQKFVEFDFVFADQRPKIIHNNQVFVLTDDSNNIFNLILSLVSWQDDPLAQSFAYALNESIYRLFIVDFNIYSPVKLHSTIQGIFGCKIDDIALAHATRAEDVEYTVVLTDILNDVFDDKISSNQHICVKHLL